MEVKSSHFRSRCRLAFAGLLSALALALSAFAQTDISTPPLQIDDGLSYIITISPFDNGGVDAWIGGYLSGGNTLTISSSGYLSGVVYGYVGANNDNNSVTVDGGRWDNNQDLSIGNFGNNNSLIIQNAGQVNSLYGYLGGIDTTHASGSPTPTFTGDDATGGGNNSVMITGTGSAWNVANDFHIGWSGSATGNNVTVDSGGQLNVNGVFTVGKYGSANSLIIQNGGLVSVLSSVNIGADNLWGGGNNNSALITGSGSAWTVTGDLTIGDFGGAGNSMVIANSGQVSNANGVIGNDVLTGLSFNNSVLVTGSGSTWNNSGDVNVGYLSSSNSLTIADGGVVNSVNGYIGFGISTLGGASSSNAVLVTGTGSLWNNSGDLTIGNIAGASSNSMTIAAGGQVNNNNGSIGGVEGSDNNTALVTGVGSLWNNNADLFVGCGSYNSLTIANGGRVVNGTGKIGYYISSIGNTVTVSDGSVWTNSGNLYVGWSGSGNNLTVLSSGQVFSVSGYVGYDTNAVANSVVVSGSGSIWTNSNELHLGDFASGNSLTIANSGMVVAGLGFIGYVDGATNNSAVVTGVGSIWNNTNGLAVGYGGSYNYLLVTNGGVVLSGSTGGVGVLGSASFNGVLISGNGSAWSNSGSFAVGWFGSGNQLAINSGGRLVTADALIGGDANASNNLVWVTGAGSLWNINGGLTLGMASFGNQLLVNSGGAVRVTGSLWIGTNASLLNSAAGTLYIGGDFNNTSTNQALDDFSGTTVFNGGGVTQSVEVASAFARPGLGGATNFYFGSFLVGDAITGSNAWVRLVNNRVNTAGAGNETFGASNLVVALSQSVLDLNSRTSFVYNLSNAGVILQTNAGQPGVVTRLDIVNTFTNAGTIIVGNGSVLQFSNAFINAGIVQLLAGGVLTNFTGGGVLTNMASLCGNGFVSALIRNAGTITATGGLLRLTGGFSDGTLGGQINAGMLQALSAGATIEVDQTFDNTGAIAVTNGVFIGQGLVNENIVRVDNQGTATFNGTVTNAANATIFASNQSLLRFNGNVVNNGTLSLVNPSTAIVTGTLTLGAAGVVSMTRAEDMLLLRGDFINASTNNMDFNTRYATLVFGGATPLSGAGAVTNSFEVAGVNIGPTMAGFNNNFAVGTLNITNHIQFVNNINNGGGLGTNEALYVDVLHLFSGATIKLSQLTIYVGTSFIDDVVGQTFAGDSITAANVHNYLGFDLSTHVFLDSGGQIVFVPEPSGAALLLTGMAGASWMRRRRPRRS